MKQILNSDLFFDPHHKSDGLHLSDSGKRR